MSEQIYEIVVLTKCKLIVGRCGAGETLDFINNNVDSELLKLANVIPDCVNCREYQAWKKSGLSVEKYHEAEVLRRLDEEEFNEEYR